MSVEIVVGAVAGAICAPVVVLLARWFTVGAKRPDTSWSSQLVVFIGCVAAGVAVSLLPGLATRILYGVFVVVVISIALVDATEMRIPDRLTYPLLAAGVFGLPWLHHPLSWGVAVAPIVGACAAGLWEFLMALMADHGPGDVKLAAVIGGWMAPLGLLPWVAGLMIGQLAMVLLLGAGILGRRRSGRPATHIALGPALAVGAVLAVVVAGF